jgi:hypothetical protein
MNQRALFLTYLLSICLISILHTQEKFPPGKDLVESSYYEGFRKYKNVGAGQIKLISCLAKFAKELPEDQSLFNIGFYIPPDLSNKHIDTFIEERKQKSYYMIPVQKNWVEGFQTFSWNSEKAAEQNIGLYDLWGFSKVKDFDFAQPIVPITFYYSQKPTQIEYYEFAFIAPRSVDLRYTIYDESEQVVASPRSLKNQPGNIDIIIEWNCQNHKSGKYILLIEYVLKDGKRDQRKKAYEFYHQN